MEPAVIISSALLITLILLELTYFSYHLWVASASSKYSVPKGYLGSAPIVVFHIPVKGEPQALLERALASIEQLKYPKDRIKVVVVCDDEDPKPMEDVCRRAQEKLEVIFIHRSKARGFKAGALNEALRVEGDVVVVLDVDSIIPSNFLIKALPSLYEADDVAAVTTRWEPLNPSESLVSEAVSFGQNFFTRGLFRGLQAKFGSSILMGSGCLLRRDTLLKVGMWDEKCVLEDVELSVRLRAKGYRIVYNDSVPIWVEHPASYSDLKKQQRRWACGASQVILKHIKSILTSRLKSTEKLSLLIYLTQYCGLAIVGFSIILLPLLASFNGEPSLPLILPLLVIAMSLMGVYGYKLTRYRLSEHGLLRGIKALGRIAALTVAMSLDVLISSLRPLIKLKCGWRVTPKGSSKRFLKHVPVLEFVLALLLMFTLILSAMKSLLTLTSWSAVYLAALAYVILKRFG
ncbi:MAG: glycosyltransferase [Candidatus Nezhaarchaeota archaeon]|nr:glycosyltransferase [Candidatus Nezhaarchaeota archaeon]MCX8142478.1 glycosyltransferase [Candidatus Nezhaarchaeota archaeon]MDW8050549.1 glycosyltransferase [Nitrososphaerota archaeon]